MRTVTKTFILFFLFSAGLNAQSVNFGLMTGLNLSSFSGTNYSIIADDIRLDLNPKIGVRYSGGIIARLNFNRSIALQSEILYVTKGSRYNQVISVREQEFRVSGNIALGYVEVPLLLRISSTLRDRGPLFYPKPGFTYNAYAGGTFSYRTRSTLSGEFIGELFGATFEEEFLNRVWHQFNDIDYGLVIGIGFEYGAQPDSKVLLDLRYTHGLTNVANDPIINMDLKNGTLSFMVGLIF